MASSRQRHWILLLLGLWLVGPSLTAQTIRVANPGTGGVSLDGPWRFHVGDDPQWAGPGFNDASWSTIRPDTPWGSQGYAGYTGYAWYRLHFEVLGQGPQLGILFPSVDDNFTVYLNGISLGTVGGFPPRAHLRNADPGNIVYLPVSGSRPASGVLAIRVWKLQLASNDPMALGGLEATPVLGSLPVLSSLRDAAVSTHDHLFVTREMLSSVILIAGLISGVIFLRGSREPLYGWLAVYLVADSSSALLSTLYWFRFSFFGLQLLNAARVTACTVALWLILLHLFEMSEMPGWRRVTRVLGLSVVLTQVIDTVALYFWQFDSSALRWIDASTTVLYTLLPIYMFVVLAVGLRARTRVNLWPLAVAVTAYGLYNFVIEGANQGRRFTGLEWPQAIDTSTVSLLGYPVGARTLLDAFFVSALLLTVARLHASQRTRRNALELELKSAQEIQRILVPDQLPSIPGFVAAAAYQPASEVGGDFFQIIPTPSGGILAIIGDVSGKGLKAAMTVSLIVGALHTLAESSDSPSVLLAGINRRLAGRNAGGFATCIAMNISPGGDVTMANAGHLAPFLNGAELPLAGTLPLGLEEDLIYEETRFRLRPGDRLTLFTDGLLEARNAAGELFGFDRVQSLIEQLPSVQEMLRQATIFGQEDDITLLTVARDR